MNTAATEPILDVEYAGAWSVYRYRNEIGQVGLSFYHPEHQPDETRGEITPHEALELARALIAQAIPALADARDPTVRRTAVPSSEHATHAPCSHQKEGDAP